MAFPAAGQGRAGKNQLQAAPEKKGPRPKAGGKLGCNDALNGMKPVRLMDGNTRIG